MISEFLAAFGLLAIATTLTIAIIWIVYLAACWNRGDFK